MEEWASEGELKWIYCTTYQTAEDIVPAAAGAGIHGRGAGESTPLTKSAYVSMHERVFLSTKPGGTAGADRS